MAAGLRRKDHFDELLGALNPNVALPTHIASEIVDSQYFTRYVGAELADGHAAHTAAENQERAVRGAAAEHGAKRPLGVSACYPAEVMCALCSQRRVLSAARRAARSAPYILLYVLHPAVKQLRAQRGPHDLVHREQKLRMRLRHCAGSLSDGC